MSNLDMNKKIEIVKELLKNIHRGESVEEIKRRFSDILSQISPFEIPIIEQQLVKEGISIDDILKLCDLHVELFREFLKSRELRDVLKGHPIDLLMRENEWILKQADALALYASALTRSRGFEEAKNILDALNVVLQNLRRLRLHYRKIQMLIFPYLERRGIVAVPRVMWGREDQVIVKMRQFSEFVSKAFNRLDQMVINSIADRALEIAREVSELVFRENKILFPAVWALFSEGEWVAIDEIANDIGWLVDVGEKLWIPKTSPVMPYEVEATITHDQIDKLPPEFKSMALTHGIQPDTYKIKRDEDIDLETGFLNVKEISSLFGSLPLEITYANIDDRVKFFSESMFGRGFTRTKTIIGRRLEYCHPPRLEALVRKTVDEVKSGEAKYREFWTRVGDRVIRVLIVGVKDDSGGYLGTVEIVEDLTDVINNVDEIKKKILVL
jgi:DUF438 domain-containing protein